MECFLFLLVFHLLYLSMLWVLVTWMTSSTTYIKTDFKNKYWKRWSNGAKLIKI